MLRPWSFVGLAFALTLSACSREGPRAPSTASAAAVDDRASASWLCRPDLPSDPCRAADLTSTELLADGTRVATEHRLAEHPRVDCFYVYPTVDLELVPGNHASFADDRAIRATTLAQAARFTETCALWVPLYHQVTIGTYLQDRATLERGLAVAFADVERAFTAYLATADSKRKIVLIGHSQGAEMVVRLLRRFFDGPGDVALRERLLLALPIGGDVDVLPGQTRGGTFQNVPLCSHAGETGCVVAYRTYLAGEAVDPDRFAPPSGRETACVNPAALDAPGAGGVGAAPLAATFAIWPSMRRFMRGIGEVQTPFVSLRHFYEARCVKGERGYAWLEVAEGAHPGDHRQSPVDLRDRRLRMGKLGLHVLDLSLPQDDLVALVSRRAGALGPHEPHATDARQ